MRCGLGLLYVRYVWLGLDNSPLWRYCCVLPLDCEIRRRRQRIVVGIGGGGFEDGIQGRFDLEHGRADSHRRSSSGECAWTGETRRSRRHRRCDCLALDRMSLCLVDGRLPLLCWLVHLHLDLRHSFLLDFVDLVRHSVQQCLRLAVHLRVDALEHLSQRDHVVWIQATTIAEPAVIELAKDTENSAISKLRLSLHHAPWVLSPCRTHVVLDESSHSALDSHAEGQVAACTTEQAKTDVSDSSGVGWTSATA